MNTDAAMTSLSMEQAVERLHAGKPLLFPTDTVFGLGAAVLHAEGPTELNRLKGREDGQPIAWLVADASALERYGVDVPPYAHALARAFWPGALTLIVCASDDVPASFRALNGTVALRMPDHRAALSLITATESPLATTSANVTGERPPCTVAQVDEALRAKAPTFVSGEKGSGRASTIVDCRGAAPRIVREGGIPARAIEAISPAR